MEVFRIFIEMQEKTLRCYANDNIAYYKKKSYYNYDLDPRDFRHNRLPHNFWTCVKFATHNEAHKVLHVISRLVQIHYGVKMSPIITVFMMVIFETSFNNIIISYLTNRNWDCKKNCIFRMKDNGTCCKLLLLILPYISCQCCIFLNHGSLLPIIYFFNNCHGTA